MLNGKCSEEFSQQPVLHILFLTAVCGNGYLDHREAIECTVLCQYDDGIEKFAKQRGNGTELPIMGKGNKEICRPIFGIPAIVLCARWSG